MSDSKMDFVEYGGHMIRRGLAEEIERDIQTDAALNKSYYALLESIGRGEVDWMAPAMKVEGVTVTVGQIVQEIGHNVGANFPGEEKLRRERVEEELDFGGALKGLEKVMKAKSLEHGLNKEEREKTTLGELFRLDDQEGIT